MTLLQRRLRVIWTRYVAPGALERDARFHAFLRATTRRGLQAAGLVAVTVLTVYTLYRLVSGERFLWSESTVVTPGSYIQVWDKVLVAGLAVVLWVTGRIGIGLRAGRLGMMGFLLVVGWVVVLKNFEPGHYNLAASWLTLLLVVGTGLVPFQPWQVGVLGLAMAAEYGAFALLAPGVGSGDEARFVFLLLASVVVSVVAGALYASRYGQYRAVRRIARLKDYAAARSVALEAALKRERAMQGQLVQQEKLASLGQLTAGIAHEIKNPLNFVTNFAGLSKDLAGEVRDALLADPDRPARAVAEELSEALDDLLLNTEKIAEHGRRADGIVRSMLAHSRATPGERRPVDLNRLLDEYVGLAYHGMRARHSGFNVEIERRYDEGIGPIPAVAEEIGRVFLNLLGNAFDALRARAAEAERTGEDGYVPRLRVTTRRAAGGAAAGVAVYISDNGPGMPPEVRERVFEPFFTTKPSGEGTGLGLSLAYEVVTQGHGGTLDVRSRAGEGTVFSMTLPERPPVTDDVAADVLTPVPPAVEGSGGVTPPSEAT